MSDTHVNSLLRIARLYQKRRLYGEAEKLYKEIFDIQTAKSEFDSSETALALYYMGDLLVDQGASREAIPYYKMALRVWSSLQEFEPLPEELISDALSFLRDQARDIVTTTLQNVDMTKLKD